MESHQEPTIIHFFRAGVLLAALIAVPGTAVCWNLIPKEIFYESKESHFASNPTFVENEDDEEMIVEEAFPDRGDEMHALQNPLSEPTLSGVPDQNSISSGNLASPGFDFHFSAAEIGGIRTMGGSTTDRTMESGISTDISQGKNVWATGEANDVPKQLPASFSGERLPSQRNFPMLENQLKQLGAKYYRLEKWGSRGELFRFSCYVAPTESYQYQKYFQAIDSDELRVMERVVDDIRQWKERN